MAETTKEGRQWDRMGRLHNELIVVIEKEALDVTETYMVLDNIKRSLLVNMRKATGQE